MASQFPSGKPVVGRITQGISTNSISITFKDINGVAHAFVKGERLIIDTAIFNTRGNSNDLILFQDANGDGNLAAGEQLLIASFTNPASNSGNLSMPMNFPNGLATMRINALATNTFYMVASVSAAFDVLVVGEVIKD